MWELRGDQPGDEVDVSVDFIDVHFSRIHQGMPCSQSDKAKRPHF